MTVRRRRRAAWATGLSLILHALFLAGMVLGLRVVTPPPEDRAMEVRLMPPSRTPPRPASVRLPPAPERPKASPPTRPHLTPSPSASVATLVPPQAAAPAPTPAPRPQYGPDVMQPSLSGRLGCDDPLNYHLTPEQRQLCDNHMARLGREAKRLVPDISDANKADYDRRVRCHDSSTRSALPRSDSSDDSTGAIGGLGYNPSFKECRAQDR
jgi:hypothetical protein